VGPLTGLRVVEMAGLGPVPHAAMQLADMGADVIRVARPGPRAMAELAGATDLFLVTGILAALWERERSGRGQVVDVAMVDGIGVLAQKVWAMRGAGTWSEERHANLLDGGAPFYDTYACADGRYVAVAAIERQFFAELLKGLGLGSPSDFGDQYDRAAWPRLRESIRGAIASRTRDEWALVFDGTDACVTSVLTLTEALSHPHAVARSAFVTIDGLDQLAPAPRFERTPLPVPASPGQDEDGGLRAVLRRWQDG